jgi:hypothetical protein
MDAATTSESVIAWISAAIWGLVLLSVLFYFVGSYLVEILAQKLDEPRWMAWVPIANMYLMLKLVGWEKWFWVFLGGHAVLLLAVFLPPAVTFVAMLLTIPIGLTALVLGFGYWPKLATRRDLPLWVGLLMIAPQFVAGLIGGVYPGAWIVALLASLVGFGAFLYIVFHDGRPKSAPHPIGYALTLVGGLLMAGLLHVVPERLAANPAFQQGLQQFSQQLEASLGDSSKEGFSAEALLGSIGAVPGEQSEMGVPTSEGSDGPAPQHVATTCPPETREAGLRAPEGRDWWCEIETPDGWVRHGPARTWLANGQLETEGEYHRGLRTGSWTRYWPSGVRRAQAEFRDGEQHGWQHGWDEYGDPASKVYYEAGKPLPASHVAGA